MAFNGLTDAQAERLSMLSEEAGEVVQAIGKILRHGYVATDHNQSPPVKHDNGAELAIELGQLIGIVDQMVMDGDLQWMVLAKAREKKWPDSLPYTHHQKLPR